MRDQGAASSTAGRPIRDTATTSSFGTMAPNGLLQLTTSSGPSGPAMATPNATSEIIVNRIEPYHANRRNRLMTPRDTDSPAEHESRPPLP